MPGRSGSPRRPTGTTDGHWPVSPMARIGWRGPSWAISAPSADRAARRQLVASCSAHSSRGIAVGNGRRTCPAAAVQVEGGRAGAGRADVHGDQHLAGGGRIGVSGHGAQPRTSWWALILSLSRVISAPFSAPVE